MKNLRVTNMSCSTCFYRKQKGVEKSTGIHIVSMCYAGEEMILPIKTNNSSTEPFLASDLVCDDWVQNFGEYNASK